MSARISGELVGVADLTIDCVGVGVFVCTTVGALAPFTCSSIEVVWLDFGLRSWRRPPPSVSGRRKST